MQTVRLMTAAAMARQGDVLIVPVARRPAETDLGKTLKEGKRLVLATGEVTGHAHAIYPELDRAEAIHKNPNPASLYELHNANRYVDLAKGFPTDGAMYLEVRERCLVRHEEHHAVYLAPGNYVVIHQHEHDGFEEIRRVTD